MRDIKQPTREQLQRRRAEERSLVVRALHPSPSPSINCLRCVYTTLSSVIKYSSQNQAGAAASRYRSCIIFACRLRLSKSTVLYKRRASDINVESLLFKRDERVLSSREICMRYYSDDVKFASFYAKMHWRRTEKITYYLYYMTFIYNTITGVRVQICRRIKRIHFFHLTPSILRLRSKPGFYITKCFIHDRWEITLSTITALIAAKRDALRMNLPDRRGREVI